MLHDAGYHVAINFQPAPSAVPDGYFADSGATFGDRGNGMMFGWNANNSANTRDKNMTSDQRYDTLAHMQKGGTFTWEIAVPNGDYAVHVAAGDAGYWDSVYKIAAEGVVAASGTPTSAKRWIEGDVNVTVTDGRLTLSNAAGSSNNKICWVTIDASHTTPAVDVSAPDTSAAETGNTGTFRLTRSGDLDADLVVNYRIGGTATAGVDYDALAASATIPAGSASVDLLVTPIDDLLLEPAKSITLTLLPTEDYVQGTTKFAAITIMDNEASAVELPYFATPQRLSQTIEAENFDHGPNTISYRDKSAGNIGSVYRFGDADIEPTSDINGGYAVTHLTAGEWMKYTIDVPVSGTYRIETRIASTTTGGGFHIEFDGSNKTGNLALPGTAGAWKTLTKSGVSLTAGVHVMRLKIDTANVLNADVGAVNYIRLLRDLSGTSKVTWTNAAAAPMAREEAQTASFGGKAYVFGGLYVSGGKFLATSRVDAYDPATNTWTRLGDMPEPLTHCAIAVDDAKSAAWFIGGYVGNHPGAATAHVWAYNFLTDTWTPGPDLPELRGAGTGALIGRELHYTGGRDFEREVDEVDHWALNLDDVANGWSTRAALPDARNHLSSSMLNGKWYVLGGQHLEERDSMNVSRVDVYDPATDTWSGAADLPLPLSHVGMATFTMNGKLVTVGGELMHNAVSSQVLVYDPATDVWSLLGYLPAGRRAMTACLIGDQIFATGGFNGGVQYTTAWLCKPIV